MPVTCIQYLLLLLFGKPIIDITQLRTKAVVTCLHDHSSDCLTVFLLLVFRLSLCIYYELVQCIGFRPWDSDGVVLIKTAVKPLASAMGI